MYAAIDIGSNTVQMLICDAVQGRLGNRRNYIATTRLGGGAPDGRLSREAITHTAQVVAGFMAEIAAAGAAAPGHCRIIATSAVRDASNGDELRQAIALAAPQAPLVEVISGRREAAMSYLGARCSLDFPQDWPVADVGGSSSELIFDDGSGLQGVSANVGCVRAAKHEWSREEISIRLAQVFRLPRPAPGCVGVAGTITTAAAWQLGLAAYSREAVEGLVLTADDLQRQLERLLALPRERRRELSPLLAHRGEVMAEGLWIWLSVLELVGVDRVRVCGGGIPDGAVAELAGGLTRREL